MEDFSVSSANAFLLLNVKSTTKRANSPASWPFTRQKITKRGRSDEVGSRMHFDENFKISMGCQKFRENPLNVKVRGGLFVDKRYQRDKKTQNAIRRLPPTTSAEWPGPRELLLRWNPSGQFKHGQPMQTSCVAKKPSDQSTAAGNCTNLLGRVLSLRHRDGSDRLAPRSLRALQR